MGHGNGVKVRLSIGNRRKIIEFLGTNRLNKTLVGNTAGKVQIEHKNVAVPNQ